ncbi:hypothetical protein PHLGIDRAFT_24640 [Phlebiopsis gigantea 11061_1 CR5-6]|uniref:Uncharacterized protein n=1 Tax=Phlebiopsis gigantea (strain 11061_1 CR5-6) TaxID=745531 RepID=A0A0C3S6N6_PHLG1|nr:hypothetical protein PHLGIDRAFT_24640 [Phlebiopsis gigantea 11061_1 CR5-6]
MHLHRHIWSHNATKEALNIVRDVIHSSPKPLTIHEVYRLALQQPSTQTAKNPIKHMKNSSQVIELDGPLPPTNDHVIRSISYLKSAVLPVLAKRNEVQRVHTTVTFTKEELAARLQNLDKAARRTANVHSTQAVFAWKPKAPQGKPKPKPVPEVFGKEVGVGEDWIHLNRRRRRAREASVARDVAWLRDLEQARKEAASS